MQKSFGTESQGIMLFCGTFVLFCVVAYFLSKRNLKEKVLSYLTGQARQHNSRSFTIPFNRQKMADYLAADRSALSAVLGKLKNEGILDFQKNRFTIQQNLLIKKKEE